MKNINTKFEQFILENKKSDDKYTLYDVDDNLIASFKTFDKEAINKTIVDHLEKNPDGMVTYHIDGDVNAVYEVNPKTDKPSLVITKGDKDTYKPLVVKDSKK